MRFRCSRRFGQLLASRKLHFESLERRDLLAVMRIVNWNTFNGPNDVTGDANFSTIMQAIGNESVQGNTQRIDILGIQETDPPGAGDSIGRIRNVLNSLYATTSYSLVVTPVDGGGDSTGFVYDTSTVSLLESVQVGAGTLTHNVMRAKFQPLSSGTSGVFYVYSVHLKSGDTSSDETLRGSEAAFLHADANSLGEGTQVLMVGDFNMHTSAEVAWTNLLASGASSVQDVASMPGNWLDNEAFKSLHSQDPGGAMDDRFDLQFASGEFFDATGVDYISGSFHVFGNNGTHTLNASIDTGNGASPAVLAALIAASDHLPAVADYQILSMEPGVRINETGGTQVAEGGISDSYQIVLNTVPAANVVVTVTPDSQVDIGNGAGVARQFTFTPANALIPQMVVVNAIDDALGEGDHLSLITHASVSDDPIYNGVSIASVSVSIIDNDTSIVISELMYNPASDETSPGIGEWIEVVNSGTTVINIGGWQFDDEDATDWGAIPLGTILGSNQIAVFFDSAFTDAATFRAAWSVPAAALVLGISWGSLGNTPAPGNEVLQLRDNHSIQRDVVNYDDTSPWPAASEGPSIYLKNLAADNSVGSNWARSATTNKAVSPTGSVFAAADVGSPGRVFLAGDYNLNGAVDTADYLLWRKTLGQTGPSLAADGSGLTVGTPNGVVDQADYTFWRSNFGAIGVPNGGLGSGGGAGDGASALLADGMSITMSSPTITPVVASALIAEGTAVVGKPVSLFDLASTVWDGSNTSHAELASTSNPTMSFASDLLLSISARGDAQHSLVCTSDSQTTPTDDSCDDIDELFTVFGEDDNALRLRWAAVL